MENLSNRRNKRDQEIKLITEKAIKLIKEQKRLLIAV